RAFFEGVIRDHLDLGRPDQVSLTFDRRVTRRTPGTFRTRVITRGVDPQIHANYKSSRIKGQRVAVLFTKTYGRVLTPGIALLDPALPEHLAKRSPLAVDWRRFNTTLEEFMTQEMIAA
ncbi:MAG TPA: hypothetical protein VIG24_08120, partial [Acidimicrobiia bacterium]